MARYVRMTVYAHRHHRVWKTEDENCVDVVLSGNAGEVIIPKVSKESAWIEYPIGASVYVAAFLKGVEAEVDGTSLRHLSSIESGNVQ